MSKTKYHRESIPRRFFFFSFFFVAPCPLPSSRTLVPFQLSNPAQHDMRVTYSFHSGGKKEKRKRKVLYEIMCVPSR